MEAHNKYTVLHRLLHWIMAFAMPVMFITGFLRMNWMNKNEMVAVMESKTSAIPKDIMSEIAGAIREPMWQWHEIFAKVMIFAFLVRIIYMLTKGIRFPNPFKSNLPVKERLQGFTYVYFYLYVFTAIVTGVIIENDLFKAIGHEVEVVHKWGLYLFPAFVLLHFAGIAIAELTNKKGVSSKMIGGD